MKKWDNLDYQRISEASLQKGLLSTKFSNGDIITLSIDSLLPVDVSIVDEDSLTYNDYEILVKSKKQDIVIPWDRIRIITDKDFAQDMADKAEQHARLVGTKLKILRERKGLKANELADRASVTPQTISRIENGHTDINFATLRKLLAAMGCTLKDLAQQEVVVNENSPVTWDVFVQRLGKIGIDSFLINKIIPHELRNLTSGKALLPDLIKSEITNYVSKIFGWTASELWESDHLTVPTNALELARFKTPSKGNLSQIRAYSHYAHYLSNAVCKVNSKTPTIEYPGDIDEFRDTFYSIYKTLNLQNLLRYTWDMGIAVIPLNDPGIFHGASWNINDKHIIILKQRNDSHARWIFDLLHELYHVFVHLEEPNSSVIETEELNPFGNNDSPEELEANAFANKFIFGESAEPIAKEVLSDAHYRIEQLKTSVQKIADRENIGAEFIANYLAFRLQSGGQNWWGTAKSFQKTDPSPFILAVQILKDRIEIDNLNPIDKNLLTSAINI